MEAPSIGPWKQASAPRKDMIVDANGGGNIICESVHPRNRPLIREAPALLAVLQKAYYECVDSGIQPPWLIEARDVLSRVTLGRNPSIVIRDENDYDLFELVRGFCLSEATAVEAGIKEEVNAFRFIAMTNRFQAFMAVIDKIDALKKEIRLMERKENHES